MLFLFGGQSEYDRHFSSRNVHSGIEQFDIITNQWSRIELINPKKQPVARRNHVAIIIDQRFFIYGGLDEKNTYLSDVWELVIHQKKWIKITPVLSNEVEEDYGIAFHTACMIYDSILLLDRTTDRKEEVVNPKFQKWRIIEEKKKKTVSNLDHIIKIQGIYVFGGKKENGSASNTLKVLKIDTKKYMWVQPTTKGIPPLARYKHTMNFFAPSRILIIYGGTDAKRNVNYFAAYYTHIGVLDVTTMEWISVKIKGEIPA